MNITVTFKMAIKDFPARWSRKSCWFVECRELRQESRVKIRQVSPEGGSQGSCGHGKPLQHSSGGGESWCPKSKQQQLGH